MIIIEVNGGLGNQLQQYALYEKFKALGKEVRLDTSWFTEGQKAKAGTSLERKTENKGTVRRNLELDYFPKITYEVCTTEEKRHIMGNSGFFAKAARKLGLTKDKRYTECQMYDEALFLLDDRVLTGYWACEAYYRDILPQLRQKLVFPLSDNPLNGEMKKQIEKTGAVSLHLRRGDYSLAENQRMFGGICTDAYYASAIAYIRKRVEEPHFYVFSDEPDYARRFMEGVKEQGHGTLAEKSGKRKEKPDIDGKDGCNYTIVDINHGKDSFYDMELMSLCRHHICANSTFSFWGARLNLDPDRIAIRPLKQKNGVDWYRPEAMKRLWPGWVFIDEKGSLQ